jgi:hypothetical protein
VEQLVEVQMRVRAARSRERGVQLSSERLKQLFCRHDYPLMSDVGVAALVGPLDAKLDVESGSIMNRSQV